ncbi:Uncharacterised protein [uncultured Clostridium sp.]|uniref:hypothetical protein n=1 Tax=uncultured Clostridium sp. TaxID=59620 RepID=UPI0008221516|nr:hypothetical protein [uncultured Clostridium sp.]SCI99584.1 Uncharacterised protein [uncultured Clostridium sp.]
MEMLKKEMEIMREKAEEVARKLEKFNGSEIRAGASSSRKLLFDMYLGSKYDYFKIVVPYSEDKTVKEYLLEVVDKTLKDDYTYYRATELEKKLIDYIKENKIKNAWVCEGELIIDVKGYTLDPIDLKYFNDYNFEINNGKLELAIKYEDDYEIFIEHIFDELYVTEYDGEGNECCIYCHEAECDCLENQIEEDDKCYCAELSESLMCANQEIEGLQEVIEKQKQEIEDLKNALAISEYLRKC